MYAGYYCRDEDSGLTPEGTGEEHTGGISKCPGPRLRMAKKRKSEDHPLYVVSIQSLCDEFCLKVKNET